MKPTLSTETIPKNEGGAAAGVPRPKKRPAIPPVPLRAMFFIFKIFLIRSKYGTNKANLTNRRSHFFFKFFYFFARETFPTNKPLY
jgi:hypothetical protein